MRPEAQEPAIRFPGLLSVDLTFDEDRTAAWQLCLREVAYVLQLEEYLFELLLVLKIITADESVAT